MLVGPRYRGGDGHFRDEQPPGRLRCRPSTSGAEFEDGEALHRAVVRTSMRRHELHASVLDAQFLTRQSA